jgi:hypothetical protein
MRGGEKMKKIRSILVLTLLIIAISSPCYSSEWAKSYGGIEDDHATSIYSSPDGGYIVAGSRGSVPWANWSVWILKLDSSGTAQWQNLYEISQAEYARFMQPTSDGGYIVAANRGSALLILKSDSSGTLHWQKQYTFGFFTSFSVRSIHQTIDGGYIVAGDLRFGSGLTQEKSELIFKLDSNGLVMWQKLLFEDIFRNRAFIQPTQDGGCILIGYTVLIFDYQPESVISLLKFSSSGTLQWNRIFRYEDEVQYEPYYIQITPDGGYVVTGYRNTSTGGYIDGQAWVLKLSPSGEVLWNRVFIDNNGFYYYPYTIQCTNDNGYIVAGERKSSSTYVSDAWLMKLDSTGAILWQNTYGGTADDRASSISLTPDGGYAVAGNTDSFGSGATDALVLKLDCMGQIANCEIIGSSNVTPVDANFVSHEADIIVTDTSIEIQEVAVTTTESDAETTVVCIDSITVISPNGGEILSSGATHEITWSSEGDIENVKIDYSINNGADWKEIEASTENDGSYSWEVPCETSNECLVRISDADNGASDVCDAVFSIFCKLPPDIDAILNFFDESVADGTLGGHGPGNSANHRLNALRNMLERAGDLIYVNDIEGACTQLKSALGKCDSASRPPDFVTGESAEDLNDMIEELMEELGCE